MSSLLDRLALQPTEFAALPSDACERVVDFLLRWQAYDAALVCLDSLGALSLAQLQQRADALHGLGRTPEAIRLLEQRLGAHTSLPLAARLVRLHGAAGQHHAAIAAARQLSGIPGALLLGEALSASGAVSEAETVFRQVAKDAPAGRQAIAGLMRVEQQRGDWVSATSLAMRILDLAKTGPELSLDEMVALRSVLQAGDDSARVADLNRRLVERFDRDLASTQALIANARQLSLPTAGRASSRPVASDWSPVSAAAALSSITVTAKERSELSAHAHRLFGYTKFLPGQAEVLACVLRREHVLAIMPTGAGKSLCYQLPAFLGAGVTLVVSPLVALMKDQIDGLPASLRRQAVALNSSLDGDELRRIVARISAGDYRLVYVAPERLRQWPFIHALRTAGVVRLVVDEAHCISIWGHDFRPDYLHLAQAQLDLGRPPLLAMTATAPPRVRHDIERQLLGAQAGGKAAMRVLVGDIARPNLHLTALRVRDDVEQQEALIALLRQLPAPGIIYARSRKRCDELAQFLVGYGVAAAAYHAGLEERTAVQERFRRNDLAVIVATVAFGMGVDKPDIRFIVHCGLPSSVEGYYQEIGRAGRDGAISHCVLLYSEGDRATLARLSAQDQVTAERVAAAYAAIRQALGDESGGGACGVVPLAQIAAALRGSESEARMLLGVLEQVGLIRRHYDAPQTISLQRTAQRSDSRPTHAADSQAAGIHFADFALRANLQGHTTAGGEFIALAAATGIPAEALESCLLAWQGAGLLRCYPAGRVPLLSLLPAPANAAERIAGLLARRADVAQQRVQEIDDYAHVSACRHAFLCEHLGEPPTNPNASSADRRCDACDNCAAVIRLPADDGEGEDAAACVLAALTEQSWGRRSLIRLLRGDPEAPERAQVSAAFGCLADRSEQSLGQLLDSLLGEGLIAQRTLDHGGVTLEATRQGLASLKHNKATMARTAGARKRGGLPQKPPTAFARWHKKG